MKNLIDEKLKELQDLCELTEEKYQIKPKGFLVDNYLRIQDDINSYNLITAPKQIKLSEFVGKLGIGNSFGIDRHKNLIELYEINELEFDGECWQDESYLLGIRDNKIYDSNITLDDRTKWLYTLWIASTEIIDDLECDE